MDFLAIVVLMAVLYLIPELLRRNRQPRRYEYPDIPLPAPRPRQPIEDPIAVQLQAFPARSMSVREPEFAMPPAVASIKMVEEPAPWQGKLDRAALINGFIFNEILLPPRAYRPHKGASGTAIRRSGRSEL